MKHQTVSFSEQSVTAWERTKVGQLWNKVGKDLGRLELQLRNTEHKLLGCLVRHHEPEYKINIVLKKRKSRAEERGSYS